MILQAQKMLTPNNHVQNHANIGIKMANTVKRAGCKIVTRVDITNLTLLVSLII